MIYREPTQCTITLNDDQTMIKLCTADRVIFEADAKTWTEFHMEMVLHLINNYYSFGYKQGQQDKVHELKEVLQLI